MAAGDVKIAHGTPVAFTVTLASLAESASRVVGRESTSITTGTPWIDALIGGHITTGTSPTAGEQIDIWVYASHDASTLPDDFTGSDAGVTIASVEERNSGLKLLASIIVNGTSNVEYEVAPRSLAALYGGVLPEVFGLFVSHSTDVNLHATAANHNLEYVPVYYQVEQ